MNLPATRRILTILLLLASATIPPPAAGQSPAPELVRSTTPGWPQWRGPRRNGVSDESGLLGAWPADGPKLLWTSQDIGRGYSSPIVVNDLVYVTGDVGDDLIITALTTSGELRWRTKNGASWKQPYPGARSACACDGNRLYHMNSHGRLACLDAGDGRELWAVDVLDRFAAENTTWGLSESLLVHGDLVFATPCGGKGLVVALDKRTGETVWASPPIAGEQACYASPILVRCGDRMLLANSAAKHVFAVDAETGGLCWKIPQDDPKNTISTTPVLAGGRLIISNISREYGAVFAIPFNASRADKGWIRQLGISHGNAICVGDAVFGASVRGESVGWVEINPLSGANRVRSAAPPGSLIHADARFYCLTERGTMLLQQRAADGFETVGSFQLAEAKDAWAHPVICDGRLYLRFAHTLSCRDIRTQDRAAGGTP